MTKLQFLKWKKNTAKIEAEFHKMIQSIEIQKELNIKTGRSLPYIKDVSSGRKKISVKMIMIFLEAYFSDKKN